MIATKDYAFTREAHLLGNTVHLVSEGSGGQARVATLMVDLVAGGFDEAPASIARPLGPGLPRLPSDAPSTPR